jgi:acetyl-CoA synthetase
VITSFAYQIEPFEVEWALIEHPAVAEAAVVGKDDPHRTQIVTAFCVLSAGYKPGDSSHASCRSTHGRSPCRTCIHERSIAFRELPKTVSGKIPRSE